MYATERQRHITTVIAQHGKAAVAELAESLGVTAETIRRDLDALEHAGRLRRVHGGAVSAGLGSTAEASLVERQTTQLEAKRGIARAAVRLLPDDFRGSLLIDAGSSTAAVAELLANREQRREALPVICNSVPIAATLSRNPDIELHLLGGRVRGITAAAVGPVTLAQLAELRPDIAIVGTNGISARFGLSTPDPDEAAVKHAMIASARRSIVVADASKFGVETLTRFARLAQVDVLITEQPPTGALAAALRKAEVEVVLP